jgi:hypothetical protein
MDESISERNRKSDNREPSILVFIVGVLVSIVMMITISRLVFNLVPARSEFVYTEEVAFETYKEVSQRLEAIRKAYFKEIEAKEKEG